ncbi:recombinase family protein [Bacillus sp. FSL M7-0417]|uniref:recombinase family protein n=1 Tax=Bacillus sp. FSL M7-0417 TaxID=2921532 RepID=UPI002E1D846C|nr:recombinase family protein [Bacillus subtilis]
MREIKHIAIYLRISQEKKNENFETLENHRQLLTDYAKTQGWTWEEYGEVLSGGASDLEDRPQLQRLLNDIDKFDGILVVELSRLSRNGKISQFVKQECMDFDVPIITPYQVYDLANNENDRLLFDFGSLISAHEHGTIGKRSKANKIQMARRGLHVSGGVPYGYRRNNETKKLEIYEPEAVAVRLIFKLHSQGLGSRRIVDQLNNEGYLPQRSAAWNLPSVKRIMKNPAYKGTVVFQDRKRKKTRVNGKDKTYYEILDTIVVENAHEPIIEPSEWEKANVERETRAEKFVNTREKPSAQYQTILKDICFCGICGRKITFRKEKNGKVSIKPCQFQLPNSAEKCCNCGILVEYLEEDIVKDLKKYREELLQELSQLQDNDTSQIESELSDRIKHIEAQIENVKKRQANLIDLALDGVFSREELKDKKQELIDQQQDLEKSLESIQKQMENLDVSPMIDKVENIVSLLDNFETLSIEKQNNVLKKIIRKVHYTRNIPKELRELSTRNPQRRNFPYEYTIEYF